MAPLAAHTLGADVIHWLVKNSAILRTRKVGQSAYLKLEPLFLFQTHYYTLLPLPKTKEKFKARKI